MARIRFENLRKAFKDVVVIPRLELTIHEGEFFTFVGPSGCGKSTILNIIAGLEPATEGKIYFDDKVVNDLSPKERDVAMVFQSYALYPHMTVYENMAFPLKMKKTPKKIIEGDVERVASIIGLKELLQRRPKELSGGQRQRVALGRAIIRKPKVFLMDEPLSNLDARLRVEMRAELKRLHQGLRITTVYVTHDQAEAMSLSDRLAILNRGEIQQCGTPMEIYQKPLNIFVAGFIGSPPMNFFRCAVKRHQPLEIDLNGFNLSPCVESMPQGDSVVAGIRPEDIIVSEQRIEKDIEDTGNVELVEPVGSFSWVDVRWGGIKARGILDVKEKPAIGGHVMIRVKKDKVFLFDPDSGRRL
ncbi:MAG: hypothetical protein A2056_00235 [Deltaproteobacteria bacterium GWA2_42_85]|nr:MAG: hypothetical protein A2056_00235 [Deltaproteobacteria bacterium GWA2_42_85]OGP41597.1 MAG: hypothetical protein A2090_08215 [Deltaproteobacteria bacterium GWD2_42_10]OGP46738.1 MAG: hypothetical protein A2022_04700 [Deltaproteobacteria bacterium GWF2_42_12]OGQ23947.1 MAG: hypothetical protein A3D29_01810 [Deltaproteobacteria bacterium RIFCSPHIGHO2_02_FULL_42_44]OGQ36254.1 MAG: hypothetical protein A3H47_02995 [Deltaproteobacteria bacterium RIFCSPLOWO2_02_FULL_42_39]OGQ66460.1 MAG: hypo